MNEIINFISQNPTLRAVYQLARIILIILDIALLAVTLYSLRKLWAYRPRFVYDPRKWQRYLKKEKKAPSVKTPVVDSSWKKVKTKMDEGSQDSLRLAIIEADGIVDEVLKRMGLSGEHFADRLGHLSMDKYKSAERLWDAHRVRNNLVHTPDFNVSVTQAEETLAIYETFLKEIKAI